MFNKTSALGAATGGLTNGVLNNSEIFILAAAVVSILFGLYNAWWILRIEIVNKEDEVMQLKDDR
jgi:hypothetical protein